MAVPFHLPSDEETIDHYRRLDQLLIDLYELVRIIVRTPIPPAGQTPVSAEVNANLTEDEAASEDVEGVRSCQVRCTTSQVANRPATQISYRKSPVAPPRRKRRNRAPSARHHHTQHNSDKTQTPSPSSWLNVGIELRQIAEEFRTIHQLDGVVTEKKRMEVKASSLFSLLVPASLNSTIWTTVVLIVGWRLLSKNLR